ncbi:MAG: hypothetical protein WA151_09555 [Desulfatirhabdiaceae bacterium]
MKKTPDDRHPVLSVTASVHGHHRLFGRRGCTPDSQFNRGPSTLAVEFDMPSNTG